MFGLTLWRQELLLVAPFAVLIAIGTGLLMTPGAALGEPIAAVDALFTATSAVCVTGLTVVDTATAYTRFGQLVILGLIQVGGLGVMTVAALAFHVLRMHLSFRSHAAIQETFFHEDARIRLRGALLQIVGITLLIEAAGAVVLSLGLRWAGVGGWYEGTFLAVSAFCNAGFSVYSDNVIGLSGLPIVTWGLMALILLGGIGYTVLLEIGERFRRRLRRGGRREGPVRWSLHSRVAITTSAVLVVVGAVAMFVTGMTPRETTWWQTANQALFHSVSSRTAGFNAIDLAFLPLPTLMVLVPLMFIGGSPGSCAGGVKTTTAVVWGARLWARLRGRADVVIGEREIPADVVRRAAVVMALAGLWNGLGVFVLVITESAAGFRLEQLIFEQVSAFGTVGLTTGITPELSDLGKLWISLTMFLGRLGPMTLALAIVSRETRPKFGFVEERVMIG